jgi:hypothetical protein
MAGRPIVIMGVFVADLAFRAPKLPGWGETVLGLSFKMGPGGKESRPLAPATAFLRSPPVHGTDQEGRKRVVGDPSFFKLGPSPSGGLRTYRRRQRRAGVLAIAVLRFGRNAERLIWMLS